MAEKKLNGFIPVGLEANPRKKAAWRSFLLKMQHYQYSNDATINAWAWFYEGWLGHTRGPRHVE